MRNYSNQNSGRPSPGYNRTPSDRGNFNKQSKPGGYRKPYRSDREEYRGDRRPSGNQSRPYTSSSRGPVRNERPVKTEYRPSPRSEGGWLEVSGKSVEEAVELAAKRFNVKREDLKTEVVDEGKKGFLGIGSKEARVKLILKSAAVPAFAEGVLSRILHDMNLPDKVKIQKDSDGNTVLNILGPSSGTLIGRHGHTLEALQYIVSKVVQRMTGDERAIVIVDVESYLDRQKDKLKELALNLAQKAKETGVEIPMRPMSSKDRRVVHLALKDHEHVTTESRGEGLRRKVVIVPKVKASEAAVAIQPGNGSETQNQQIPSETEPQNIQDGNEPVSEGNKITPEETSSSASATLEPGNSIASDASQVLDDNIGNH